MNIGIYHVDITGTVEHCPIDSVCVKSRVKMDYRKLENSVHKCFQELEEKESSLWEKIEDLNRKKPLETRKTLLSQEVEMLRIKKKQLEEKISLEDYTIKSELLQTQEHYQQYGQTQKMKEFHEYIIGKILCLLEEDLKEHLLKCSSTEIAIERADTRETYQVYGLLLSACEFKKRSPKNEIVTKVLTLHKNQECLRENIQKAVILTKDMLTLIPPLLVTTVSQYDEKLHDTNRSTWDESGVNECRELTYYRPILVYGNQLHVAMKGLVGNTAPQQQGQQLKKPDLFHEKQEQHQQPQHTLAQYQVQQQPDPQELPHQQAHQQPQWYQAHHPHYNQQQQHPWQQMEKNGAYSYGKAGITSATSFQATHPHVPKSSQHRDKTCVVCDKPIYHQNQCHYFGPDKVLVHKECYSCVKCKRKYQLKLYYERFVCIEHINQITCKNCHKKGQMKFKDEVCFCTCQETIC